LFLITLNAGYPVLQHQTPKCSIIGLTPQITGVSRPRYFHYFNLIHILSNAIKKINSYIDNTKIVFIVLVRKRNDNSLDVTPMKKSNARRIKK